MQELRRLVSLAWPVVIGQLGLVGMGLVDMLVVGAHGEIPLASLGLGHAASHALLVAGLGACAGIDPFVTQAWGRGDAAAAGTATARGAVVVGLLSVPIALLHLATGPLLTLFRQPAEVIPGAATYAGVLAAGVLPFLGFALLRQLLQGAGLMRPATWVIVAANVLNLVLDLWLVNGLGMGVTGVAWGTVAIRWCMLLALVGLSLPTLRAAWPDQPVLHGPSLWAVAAKALPVGWQLGLEVWAFSAATLLAGALGTTATAAHTAALNATALAFMVPMGIAAAAATRVGNLVGRVENWRPAAGTALMLGGAVMAGSGSLFALAPEAVARLYNPDPVVVASVASILPIAAMFGVFDGVQVVAFGVLRGLGDTERPAWINVFGYWVVGLPVSAGLGLGLGWGLQGVWAGLSVGLGLVSVLLLIRVRSWWIAGAPALAEPAPT